MIREWFFGFHKPVLGSPALWFGHCEAWGWTDDETWLFLDPQGRGVKTYVAHRYDDVAAQIQARIELCDLILVLPAQEVDFRIPIHGPMTCAAICGGLVGIRALLPGTLRRRLLSKGAKVMHEAQGRSQGSSGQAA